MERRYVRKQTAWTKARKSLVCDAQDTGFGFVRGQHCKHIFCVLSAVVENGAGGQNEEAMCPCQDSRFGAKIKRGQIFIIDNFLC